LDQTVKEKLCSREKARVLLNGSINGIDTDVKFNPARYASARAQVREELGISASSRVIGYVGRIAGDKGIEDLLRAWRKVHAACPETALVVIGGLDHSDSPGEAILSSLRHDADVRLVGETDEVGKYLSVIEVLLFPTHREGFGLVAAEANAMEIPVVTCSVTGCVDAIVDGRTGKLVPVSDSDALAEAAIAYLRDESLRREHGQNGRIRVMRDFDRYRLWRVLLDEYSQMLQIPSSCAQTTSES
jgi:glycosyltransferase involved in cell wall biosynthesis